MSYEDDRLDSIRPTIKNVHKGHNGYTYDTAVRGVSGVMLPDDISDEDLNKLIAERNKQTAIQSMKNNYK